MTMFGEYEMIALPEQTCLLRAEMGLLTGESDNNDHYEWS